MGDFREGELHYSVELKGHLVYPAEIDAKSMSEWWEMAVDECKRRGRKTLCASTREAGEGGRAKKDKDCAKNTF